MDDSSAFETLSTILAESCAIGTPVALELGGLAARRMNLM
jgi:hypothetical protein